LRVIVDCNVLVSAALSHRSVPGIVTRFATENCQVLYSSATFSELHSTLSRPKFDKYIQEHDKLVFLLKLAEKASFIEPKESIKACRDPNDDMYLELAVAGEAGCIITGDRALLDLHPFRGIPIISPAAFVEQFMS
tara:strand:+ start:5292 stop:5699 length:408 start_codon:yes stop_codon:yes gene_type:complete